MKQRILAILLSLTMMFTLVPTAMAEGETAVAKVGDVEYETLQAAINAATAGQTVKLVASTAEDIKISADKDITLDLGNSKLTNKSGDTITVEKGGKLSISDSVGTGVVDKGFLDRGGQVLKLVEVAAQNGRGNVILNGTEDGTGGVAGDDASGGRFAIAHRAGIGVELYDDVLHTVDSAQGGFERNAERGRNAAQPDLCDLHVKTSLMFQRHGKGHPLVAKAS